ncbi:hypothetical protein DMC47_00440, partial [Nostoc sp. 3335mG]
MREARRILHRLYCLLGSNMHADIQNVFTPAYAIEDAYRFAGRQDQLDRVSMALQSRGTQIVIYGNRGVGKSSLARQLAGLARGDQIIIDRLRIKPHEIPDWLVINLECDDTIPDIKSLILRLLTDDTALAPWIPFKVEKSTNTNEVTGGLQVKLINISGKHSENLTLGKEEAKGDLYSTFSNAIMHIIESGVAQSGVLFIIDEIDRVASRTELASFIRSRASDDRVKFALVGVGTTPQELILNHESIVRQISDGCVEMPPMNDAELKQIFDNAHRELADDGISFSENAQQWIISVAKGHPYYVHLLGKHSLISAVMSNEKNVTLEMSQAALAEIAIKGTARIQETTYAKAIGHSYKREYILKELSLV